MKNKISANGQSGIAGKTVNRTWIFLVTLLISGFAAVAWAHAPLLWCYVENDHVYVEAFFMGGKKIQNGSIVVVDNNGKEIFKSVTDKNGLLNFVPQEKDDMTIILYLDAGHGSEFKITKQDFVDAEKEAAMEK